MGEEAFAKLLTSILDSSIWLENHETRIVWLTLIAMADSRGCVWAIPDAIAARAKVSLEATERAMKRFQEPDPKSRSKEHEGRRLEEIDRGWRLLNYEKIRNTRNPEARREQNREAQQRWRERHKGRL